MPSTIVNHIILLQFKLFLSTPSTIVNNIMSTLVIIIHLTYSYFRNQQRLFDDVLISSPEMLHQRITSVHQNRSQQKIMVQPSVLQVIYDYITRRRPSPHQVDNWKLEAPFLKKIHCPRYPERQQPLHHLYRRFRDPV